MGSKEDSIVWLWRHTAEYHAGRLDTGEVVEDLDKVGKLGQGFTLVDELQEVDLAEGGVTRPTCKQKIARSA
jgi:hypothetical protein